MKNETSLKFETRKVPLSRKKKQKCQQTDEYNISWKETRSKLTE